MKLLLLLRLGLTLVCAHPEEHHDVVTSNLDMSKISGEWYTILLASDIKESIEENSVMRGIVESIQAPDNSPVAIKLHIKVIGECVETPLVCEPTAENSVCNVIYAGFATMTLIEADYSDFLIFHLINFTSQQTIEMMLYARTPDVSPQLKKRFEELCQNHGIPKENVLDITSADRCVQARGSNGDLASSAE